MKRWHETLAARLGLRAGGLAVLSLAWLTGGVLYHRIHAHPPAPATIGELGLCMVFVLLGLAGNALFFVGPGLWKQVPVPGRWHAAQVEPRQFDLLVFPDPQPPAEHLQRQRGAAARQAR